MGLSNSAAVVVVVAAALCGPALAAAQEPVRDFTQLNTRLRPGDTVWVTDAQGREVKGKIRTLSLEAVALKGDGDRTLAAAEVTTIRMRETDTLRSGALIGLGVGAASGLAGCAAGGATGPSDYAWCGAIFSAIGAGIGVGIDALTPGRKIVAYRAPGAAGAPSARLSVAPFVTPRARGLGVAFSF
jgi:hypothetical protein